MADSSAQPTVQQKLGAEAIGTFVLVFFGCGSITYATQAQALSTTTTIGLTFGVAVMIMAYAFGRVSGGHFNPAVSVGAALGGRMPWPQVGLYAVAQLAGAVGGALALFLLMQGFADWDAEGNMGQNFYGDQGGADYAWWAAFLLELVLTAVFVTVILAVTDERFEHPALAPLTIGFTLAAIHFVAIPATGTSVNPVRSIGPALFAGGDSILQLWLFIIAPLLGAAVAGFGYPMLFGRASDPIPGSGLTFARPRAATVVVGPDQYQQRWNEEAGDAATAGTGAGAAQQAAPIIQDGWQWDPVGQQWHPVGQTPEQWHAQQAAQQAAEQAAEQTAQQEAAQQDPQPEQQQWGGAQQHEQEQRPDEDPGDPGTRFRPPGQ